MTTAHQYAEHAVEFIGAADTLAEDHKQQIRSYKIARGLLLEAIDEVVYDARKHGATWSDIGAMLGITKQAAHEQYAVNPSLTVVQD